jgi:ATP-dependent Lon protease
MEVKMKKYYLMAALVLLLSVGIFAQVKRKTEMKEEDPQKLIEAIKIWKISEFLELDDEQMVMFFPKLKKLEKHRRESFKERSALLEKLRTQLGKKASEEALKDLIEEVVTFDRLTKEKEQDLRDEIMSVLTIPQQAKLLIFEERFEHELREIIKEMRKERMGPPHPRDDF